LDERALPAPSGADEESLAEVLRRRVRRLLAELEGSRVEGLYPVVMREVERSLLETVLAHTSGRREQAAEILGLHRNSLRLRLRALGLAPAPLKRRRRRGERS
jgi:DNA-binding protein Fis